MSSAKHRIGERIGFVNRKVYKEFNEKYKELGISYDDYISILKESTKAIRDSILENPIGFKLPYNLGYLAVDKFKPLHHYVAVDWPNTRRLGKLVPLLNLHSFGYMFSVKFYANHKIRAL